MNYKKCDNWFDQLNKIKADLAEYQTAYSECEAAKDFSRLKPKKDELKTKILQLFDEIVQLDEVQKKQLEIQKKRLFENPKRHRRLVEDYRKLHAGSQTELSDSEVLQKIWQKVKRRLNRKWILMQSLVMMESGGGEPDLVWYDFETKKYAFVDCSKESPEGRRNICYDKIGELEAEDRRTITSGNAIAIAKAIGVKLLTPNQYAELQELDEFDLSTSNWLLTPEDQRALGSVIIGYRANEGGNKKGEAAPRKAYSCLGDRGFRGILEV